VKVDDDFEGQAPFNFDRYVEQQDKSFISEFGWPEIEDEGYTGEEGDGDDW
jgi:hypothetical protein